MKRTFSIFQALALIACLSANLQTAGGLHMPGMRRAIQAIAETASGKGAAPALPIRPAGGL